MTGGPSGQVDGARSQEMHDKILHLLKLVAKLLRTSVAWVSAHLPLVWCITASAGWLLAL